jgi:hypothetical protein
MGSFLCSLALENLPRRLVGRILGMVSLKIGNPDATLTPFLVRVVPPPVLHAISHHTRRRRRRSAARTRLRSSAPELFSQSRRNGWPHRSVGRIGIVIRAAQIDLVLLILISWFGPSIISRRWNQHPDAVLRRRRSLLGWGTALS